MTNEERAVLVDAYNLLVSIRDGQRIPEEAILNTWLARAEKLLYPSLSQLDEVIATSKRVEELLGRGER